MEENNEAVKQGKKPGKLKKILIALVALTIVAAVVLAVLCFTGKLELNFSKKDKALAGYDKMAEVVTGVATDLQTEVEEAGINTKLLLKDLNEIDASVDLSVDVNKLEISDLGSDEELLEDVFDLLSDSKVSINAKSDGEKFYASLGMSTGEVDFSAEANYDGELIGIRSKELNEQWIAVDAKEVIDVLTEEVDLEFSKEEIEEMAQKILDIADEIAFTEEEIEHFKTTYTGIPKEFLKTLDVETEKATVEIDGKDKKCTKATIKLDDEDIKELLLIYVDTVAEDDKGIEILNKKLGVIVEFLEEIYTTTNIDNDYGSYYDVPDFSSLDLTELLNSNTLDEVANEIENLDLEGLEVSINTYATVTNVYRTDIVIEIEGTKLVLECTFEGDTTTIDICVKSSGMSVDIATLKVVNEKNHKALKFELDKDMVEYSGSEMSFGVDCTIESNKLKTSFEMDLGSEGKVELINEVTVKENTETAYSANSKTTIKAKIEDVIDCDITINIDTSIKTSNVSFDNITDYIDVTDFVTTGEMSDELNGELEEYASDMIPNITKLLEKIKDIDFVDEYLADEIDDLIDELEDL